MLLLSSGGGAGNILRSLKALFRRDLSVTEKSDARYAERLRRAVTTRFLDTNEFSLADVPKEERLVIGATTTRRLGSMHDPDLARRALEESHAEVDALLSRHSVVVVIATGGKGTGAGTVLPIAQMARRQKKLVIPIFVRPSFERHEVEKRRYDHALHVARQFDAAGIRLVEILNDRGYTDDDPEPQAVVWERMNLPIARALRGLLYVLWDLSQVDPSDLSSLFAGHGRLRIGHAELDPPAGQQPTDAQIERAVRGCWENPYCVFDGPVGTCLVCIQGNWSNVVDGKIKGQLAALALGQANDGPYNPLHARALYAPRPWGVTTLFAECTGQHPPLEIDWSAERRSALRLGASVGPEGTDSEELDERVVAGPANRVVAAPTDPEPAMRVEGSAALSESAPTFPTFWEFAVAINRQDPVAVGLAGQAPSGAIPVDDRELRKLVGTFWFRSTFRRLSPEWQQRLLDVLVEHVHISDHPFRQGRRTVALHELTQVERQQALSQEGLPDAVRADVQLLVSVAMLWGAEAAKRFELAPVAHAPDTSRLGLLRQPFRHP